MTVGMITSWQEQCGIAAYTGRLVAALEARADVLERKLEDSEKTRAHDLRDSRERLAQVASDRMSVNDAKRASRECGCTLTDFENEA